LFFLRRYCVNIQNLNCTIEKIIVDGVVAAVVWANKGKDKSGEPYDNWGITFVQMRDGKIVLISDYFKDTSFLKRT
jgi:ketosteroid isomerase-like protein